MQPRFGRRSPARPLDRSRSRSLRTLAAVVVPVAMLALVMGGPAAASARPGASGPLPVFHQPYTSGEVVVRFRAGVSDAAAARVAGELGGRIERTFWLVPNLRVIRLSSGTPVPASVAAFRARPEVLYAEPNFINHVDETEPNDPSFDLQWNWKNTGQGGGVIDADVDATDAWDLSTGSASVIVGVIDTGADYTHPDLAANMWLNTAECNGTPGVDDDADGYIDDCHGIDAYNHDSDPMDDFFHGTHVSGIIGAVGNNGVGVTGMNWTVRVLPCKSHNSVGNGTEASIIECMQYMTMIKDRGEDVVATNNSYGGCPEACDYSQATYDAIAGLWKDGILFVVSAGNDGRDNDIFPKYPTNYFLPNVVSVAASDPWDAMAYFSNYGQHTVSLGAPGLSVYSTLLNDSYGYESGTSMAAPHVAGLAALLEAQDPSRDYRAIRNLIISGGDPIAAMHGKTISGLRMNAYGSMTCSGKSVFDTLRPLPTITGGTQAIAALNITCAVPAGGLTVTITPGGQVITLKDNGKGPDLAGTDGIYSGYWTPCAAGNYTLTYSSGQTAAVTVTAPVACVSLTVGSGPPGTQTTMNGTGFKPNESVDVYFETKLLATAVADGTGAFSQLVTIPAGATKGTHKLKGRGQASKIVAVTGFKVT